MTRNIIRDLRLIAPDLIDGNWNIRVMPIGKVGGLGLSVESLQLINELINLILNTDIIYDESKEYFKNRHLSCSALCEELNKVNSNKINYNTLKTKINYDKDKLAKIFGQNIIVDILMKKDITSYITAMYNYKISVNSSLDKKLLLKITSNKINCTLDDNQFNEFLEIIMPYTVQQKKFIEDNIDEEMKGYFEFLKSGFNLTSKDKERLEKLLSILGV